LTSWYKPTHFSSPWIADAVVNTFGRLMLMARTPLRQIALRLAFSATFLIVAFAVMLLHRSDSGWLSKVGIVSTFLVPTMVALGVFQFTTGRRMIWPMELILLAVVAWVISNVALFIREAMNHAH
jgi:hypothetical protein